MLTWNPQNVQKRMTSVIKLMTLVPHDECSSSSEHVFPELKLNPIRKSTVEQRLIDDKNNLLPEVQDG